MSKIETRLPLICPGDWRALEDSEALDALRIFKANHPEAQRLTGGVVIGVRQLLPSFYPGLRLIEVLLTHGNNGSSLVAIVDDEKITTFNGTSPPLHALNETGVLQLNTADDAIGYLCFFCAIVCGEEGAFYNVTSVDDIQFTDSGTMDEEVEIKPHKIINRPNGSSSNWEIETYVQYSHALFSARFNVQQNGMTEMLDDTPIIADLSVLNQKFVQGVRVLEPQAQ